MRISNLHIFSFYDFDGVPGRSVIILDSLIDFATKSTTNKMLKVEAVPSNFFFTFVFGVQ